MAQPPSARSSRKAALVIQQQPEPLKRPQPELLLDYIPGRFAVVIYRNGLPDSVVEDYLDQRCAKIMVDSLNYMSNDPARWAQAMPQPVSGRRELLTGDCKRNVAS